MNVMQVEKVIYRKGDTNIQTHVYRDASGVERCAYSGYLTGRGPDFTVPDYLKEESDSRLECIPFDDALKLIHEAQDRVFLTGWTEISEKQWTDALEVLPPDKWRTVDGVEIFRMSERTTGNITAHYARLGEQFFCGNKRTSDRYEDIAREIKEMVTG